MLHETLIHLWNDPGDCEAETSLYELQEFLHPGEKKLLEQIIDGAADYYWIVKFCENIRNSSNLIIDDGFQTVQGFTQLNYVFKLINKVCTGFAEAEQEHEAAMQSSQGQYIKSFASGVQSVLADYRSEIIKLEKMFLDNPQLSLTFILSSLEKYHTLFQVLKSIIQVFQEDNLHGCLLMGRLHNDINCGVDLIANSAQRITRSINTVFYRHLCDWIIYGDLVDMHNEFFICDGKCHDEDFVYPGQHEESTIKDTKLALDLYKRNRIKKPPPVHKFYINWDMVPMFVSEDTAESILFMGRIVWIVQNDPKKISDDHYETKHRRDIWEGKDNEYYKKLQVLENETFNSVEFQGAIEECRVKLTKYLWSVMLDEGNLKEHLQLIRDYYALGRGELFHQFILMTENHLKDAPSNYSVQNLNFIFLETARKIYGDNDKTYLRFELAPSTDEVSSTNPFSQIQLNFEMKWPLHIIFHPKSMELYNKLFCYLLRLRKTQIHLHKLWKQHMVGKQQIDRRVWTLRQHLTFLVNNLEYYLQVDVIEAQFSLLLKAVENANEFEDITKVHHEFISNLLSMTFVLTPDETHIYKNKHNLHQMPAVKFNVPSKVYNVIIRLLELCDQFCTIASTWETELTEPEVLELEEFQRRTNTEVDSLLFILYSLHEKANGQHLLQLLYQLDFNRYFSTNKPDFNLTVAP